ncbi:MAG TPA: aromatic amino acid DMT transporter YddG [Phycisphaerae bacterium]|nr:aromatic amino acid DMT transporter YddG [Phycisphaerae bacterium]
MQATRPGQLSATFLGVAAILMWGSLIGITRSVVEQLGVLWAAAVVNLLGGGLGLLILTPRMGRAAIPRGMPGKYLLGCGLLFVVYNAALYPAIRMAADRTQTVEVGLVNYLWPALTLTLAVPILGKKARPTLVPGLAMALMGIWLGMTTGSTVSLATIRAHFQNNPSPYLLGLVAAGSWSLYSNLARRWGKTVDRGAVPLFLLATGLTLAFAAVVSEPFPRHTWTVRAAAELLYLAIFPTLLAYIFWDIAMRKGNIVAVLSIAFFTPLISTFISCVYLRITMGLQLWGACGLVILGAAVCKYSVIDSGGEQVSEPDPSPDAVPSSRIGEVEQSSSDLSRRTSRMTPE